MSPTMPRRTFLGAALGTVAASAASLAGDDDISVVVIGSGSRGADLLRVLSTIEGVRIVAVADPYEPHRARGLQLAGDKAKGFADHRAMLDAVKPQAAIIAIPLVEHFRVASDVLSAGCETYLEKCMCYTLEEAAKLAEQVKKSGRVFQVGLQRRASPIYDQARDMIASGQIGRVVGARCQWHRNNSWRRPIPVPKADPGYAALDRKLNWRLYRESSRGLLAELGSHQLDAMNWLLGAHPKRVTASGGVDGWRDGRDVADNVLATFEYELPDGPDGKPYAAQVAFSSLCNNAYAGASEEVYGTEGTIVLTGVKGWLYKEPTPGILTESVRSNKPALEVGRSLAVPADPWAHRGKPIELDNAGCDDTRLALLSFLDHVRARDPRTVCDVNVGIEDTATVLMGCDALDTGRRAGWPLPARP